MIFPPKPSAPPLADGSRRGGSGGDWPGRSRPLSELEEIQSAAGAFVATGHSSDSHSAGSGLSSSVAQGSLAQKRSQSFEWALIGIVAAAAVIGALSLAERFDLNGGFAVAPALRYCLRRPACSSASVHPTGRPIRAAALAPDSGRDDASAIHRIVARGSRVGSCVEKSGLGYFPEVNEAFGVQEFTAYDPAFPCVVFLRLGPAGLKLPSVSKTVPSWLPRSGGCEW